MIHIVLLLAMMQVPCKDGSVSHDSQTHTAYKCIQGVWKKDNNIVTVKPKDELSYTIDTLGTEPNTWANPSTFRYSASAPSSLTWDANKFICTQFANKDLTGEIISFSITCIKREDNGKANTSK